MYHIALHVVKFRAEWMKIQSAAPTVELTWFRRWIMGRLVDADKYLAKAEHEATAMPEVQGESFVMLTDWLIGKT